jgi:hypothetical protein
MLLMIGAVVVVVLVAMAIIKTLVWLALVALIFVVIGLALGTFRRAGRSARRSRSRL